MMPILAVLLTLSQTPAPSPTVDPASQARLQAAAPVLAGQPNTTLVGYAVDGANPRAIRQAMNRDRPAETEGGERFDSVTDWSYATRWRRSGPDQCLANTVEVTLTVTVTLPDLVSRDRLNARDQADWDQYFERLAAHENNHVRIAVLGAELMQTAMRKATGCDQIQAERRRISDEISAASVEYDRTTEHGKREGAVYPPARRR
jgi:predicted secreted Zn-dependent protease